MIVAAGTLLMSTYSFKLNFSGACYSVILQVEISGMVFICCGFPNDCDLV